MKKFFFVLILLFIFTWPTLADLEGKVIIVNPGHGGGETGAIGPTGVVERDLNLAIGLYLTEMLEDAGAKVYLTRNGNYDLDGTAHYSGTRDRFNRLRVGREKQADIFLALHHNASVNPASNQVEVYYMPKYHGPSKDLAEYITEGLKSTMDLHGIATTMSQTIVNHATIPTIIGEASYISNPEMEKWFQNDENLQKVAIGYFRGVKKFFEHGMPVVEAITPEANQKVIHEYPLIMAKILQDGQSPIAPEEIEVRIDDQVVSHNYDAQSGLITAKVMEPLANGPHRLLVVGGNQAGIAAVPVDYTFYVDEKPAAILLHAYPTYLPGSEGTLVKIAGQVVDDDGQPVLDGNRVLFEIEYDGQLKKPWVFTREGYFVNHLYLPKSSQSIAALRIWAGDQLEEIVVDFRSQDAYISGSIQDFLTAQPIMDLKVTLSNQQRDYQAQTDRDGDYYISQIKPGKYVLGIEHLGYEILKKELQLKGRESQVHDLRLSPIAGGVFRTKKVILNTAVEGALPGAGSIIQSLKDQLAKAGAAIEVITEGTDDKSTVKKINKLFGDVLITLKLTTSDLATIYHYPRSTKNANLAKKLAISGTSVNVTGSKSKLITFANTHSFILEIPETVSPEEVVAGLYQFLIDYFSGIE